MVTAPSYAQTASSAATASSSVQEVVVTAQRRSERLQDVPITVTAVSGTSLAASGVTTSGALSQVVPAFRMDYNGAFAQPTIRGISTQIASVGGASNVGVYVDGFYNASPLTSDFALLNVTAIQVVKGPQGTLFGRNTTGGAVLVTTSDPSQTPEFEAQASYGNLNTLKTALYATGPLTDKIAIDLAAQYDSTDGYWTNIYTNDKKFGLPVIVK